jgi:mxaK protein
VINRRLIHAFFIALVISLVCIIGHHWYQLNRSQQITAALQKVSELTGDEQGAVSKPSDSTYPEVTLAMASALSKGHDLAQVESMLGELIESHENGPLAIAARFNLANAYLRQGQITDELSAKTKPMIELAKQRYRDLLRQYPTHWGARYNLEFALRLAPDVSAYSSDEKNDPVKRVRVVVPGFEKQDLP